MNVKNRKVYFFKSAYWKKSVLTSSPCIVINKFFIAYLFRIKFPIFPHTNIKKIIFIINKSKAISLPNSINNFQLPISLKTLTCLVHLNFRILLYPQSFFIFAKRLNWKYVIGDVVFDNECEAKINWQ